MKCYASGPDNQKESVVPCCLWSQHAVASCFEVFQLLQQFPDAFEFSSSILLRLAEEVRFSKNQLGKMRKKWQRYQNTLNLICTTIQMQFTVYMCIVYQKKKIQFQFQVCFAWSPTKKKRRRVVFSQRSVPSACWGIKVFTNRYGTFFCDNELPDSKIQAALTWLTA